MEIQVTGKNIDLGAALQTHVSERLTEGVGKYFGRGVEAAVTFVKERHEIECEMTAHLDSGVFLAARGEGGDAYSAFDDALAKLEKRVRRHKRRLKDHQATGKPKLPAESASYFLIESPADDAADETGGASADASDEDNPVIVAESRTALPELTVGEAVMQLDLADTPVLLFKNAAHGGLNVVYRRRDGNIGWIDPSA